MGTAIKRRSGQAWLMTGALVIVPWGGVFARKWRLAAALLLTILPVYGASRTPSAPEIAHVINAPAGLDDHIEDAAARYGVPANLIAAIIETESQFNPRAVSRRGALGLMQLMPATATSLGVGDPFDPRQNIEGGVRHLRSLMDQFGNNLPFVLAAYNAGARAVTNHRGVPPYLETRQYVKRILRQLDRDGVKAVEQTNRGQSGRRDDPGRVARLSGRTSLER